jgi:hypothetical protein
MAFWEPIGEGFRVIHRNWQLVVIQVALSALGLLGFAVAVGAALAVAFYALGMDVSQLATLRDLINDPEALLSRYLAVVLLVVLGLLVYALIISLLWVFVVAGSAGTIGLSIKEPDKEFSMRTFLREGKRLFWPLSGYALLASLIVIGLFLAFGMISGAVGSMSHLLDGGIYVNRFFRVFTSLVTTAGALALAFGLASVVLTGMMPLFEGAGPLKSLDLAVQYMKRRPGILGLYVVAFAGYFFVYLALMIPAYALNHESLGGVLLSASYQFLLNILQGYLCLVVLASAFAHYFGATAEGRVSVGVSTRGTGISEGAPGQGPPPPRRDESP